MAEIIRLNATIPRQLDEFVNHQVKSGKFSTKSDYLRHVLRKEMDEAKQDQIDYINQILRQSQDSGLCEETPNKIRTGLKQVVKGAVADRN